MLRRLQPLICAGVQFPIGVSITHQSKETVIFHNFLILRYCGYQTDTQVVNDRNPKIYFGKNCIYGVLGTTISRSVSANREWQFNGVSGPLDHAELNNDLK